MKVLTLIGTRPEIIKLSQTIRALDAACDHLLVHTGQNHDFELNEVFFRDLGLRAPDLYLDAAGGSAMATVARVLERLDSVLESEAPDAFLVLGDTNSALGAIAAKRRRIPVFHMEAGNRCFDDRVPEEVNRRLVDHASDINLVYTEHARRNLLAEGFAPDRIIKTGSPMGEVIARHLSEFDRPALLAELGLASGRFALVSAHREENVDSPERLTALIACLAALHEKTGLHVLVSVHPRTRKRLDAIGASEPPPGTAFLKPFGFLDYCALQSAASVVVSDSGTLTEEAALLGLPAVMIRQAHERPEGMDEGVAVMAELEPAGFLAAVELVRNQHSAGFRPRLPPDYAPTDVSAKVVRAITSYASFVDRVVWRAR